MKLEKLYESSGLDNVTNEYIKSSCEHIMPVSMFTMLGTKSSDLQSFLPTKTTIALKFVGS